jgi:Protein of unknown function (DUF3221)
MPTPVPAKSPQRLHALFAAMLCAATLSACANTARTTAPDGAASFAGRIESSQAGSVLLVASSVQPAGSDRAVVRVHAGTRLHFASGATATPADLHVGRNVRAWFDGPVMESYPVQASAGAIVIDP